MQARHFLRRHRQARRVREVRLILSARRHRQARPVQHHVRSARVRPRLVRGVRRPRVVRLSPSVRQARHQHLSVRRVQHHVRSARRVRLVRRLR